MAADASRVVIVGGAVVGSSVAWHLVQLGFDGLVTVIEPDPTYSRAATALSASGIRTQFSTGLNIEMAAYGLELIRRLGIDFRENGYLRLAGDADGAEALRRANAAQVSAGAEVALLEPAEIAARFPHLRLDGLVLGALGLRGEGWFDNMGLLRALRDGARAAGVTYLSDRVGGLERSGSAVRAVRLAGGGSIACDVLVNAAGGQGAEVAAMAGLSLHVERRKRTVFAFNAADPPHGPLPLVVDPTGIWVRPEGSGFIAGATPDPDPAVAADDFDPRHDEWEEVVWPVLAARSPAFEACKLTGFWAGHYDVHPLDHNAVIGPHPELPGFLFANGFSGHGLQQAPAVGRGLAEWIVHGRYTSLDLDPLGYARVAASRPLVEDAVI